MGKFAWVTLATNDSYSLGALVLAHSLKQVGTNKKLVVLITPGVSNAMRGALSMVFDVVQEVNVLDSKDQANLKLLQRPDLGITFTKLHCWRLTQFEKCVFLDADTLVLQYCDELFEREELSAAPDVGWPDCFNSGVFVFRPSNDTYEKLIDFALTKGSFDGGDQGLLNLYFSDWAHKDITKHLPFIYNMCSTALYSYLPAFKQFGGNAKIIHFIGSSKPWLIYFDTENKTVRPSSDLHHLQPILQTWWNIFCNSIHPKLSPDMSGIAAAYSQLTLGVPRSAEQSAIEDQFRRQGWETGNIDYSGRDSFDNIWSKICHTISQPEPTKEKSPPKAPAPVPQQPQPPVAIQSPPVQQQPPKEAPTAPAPAQAPVAVQSPPAQQQPPKEAPTAPASVQSEVCAIQAPPAVQSPSAQQQQPPKEAPTAPAPVQPEVCAIKAPPAQAPVAVQSPPAQPEVTAKKVTEAPLAQATPTPPTQVSVAPVPAQSPPAQPEVCAKKAPPAQLQSPPASPTKAPTAPVSVQSPEVCAKKAPAPEQPPQAPPRHVPVQSPQASVPTQQPPASPTQKSAQPVSPKPSTPEQPKAEPQLPKAAPPSPKVVPEQQQPKPAAAASAPKPVEQPKPKEAAAKPAPAEQSSGKSKKKK